MKTKVRNNIEDLNPSKLDAGTSTNTHIASKLASLFSQNRQGELQPKEGKKKFNMKHKNESFKKN